MFLLAAALAATLSVEDYATMPQISSPRWSPDGKRIAYVVTRADMEKSAYDSDVWLVDADGANQRQLTRAAGNDAHPRWSPDGSRLAFLSERAGTAQVFLLDANGGEAWPLTHEPTGIREFEWAPDGRSIAFLRADEPTAEELKRAKERDDAHVEGEGTRFVHLYVVDVEHGSVRRLTHGAFSIFNFSWSPDGTTIAFDRAPSTGLDDYYRTDIDLISVADGTVRPLVHRTGIDHAPKYSPDGKWIAFGSGGGVHDWLTEQDVEVVPASGGTPKAISQQYGRTPDTIDWSLDSRSVWIEGPWNTTTQLFRVNVDGTGFSNVTKFDGVISDADMHGERIAYVRQSLTEPPELFASGKQITHHNDAYRGRALGTTRVIRWKNPQDGLEIEGLLTLPVGYREGTKVPLLTFVHGGPASRFDQSFLGYLGTLYAPQTLAANGFAVLRPNPRGTGGYGAAFRAANRNDWGGMDWVDINAGIDKVVADGIADPAHLGLMGWSYGGFMAAWAMGHSDRFLAISAGAPVVDLLGMHGTSDIRDFVPHYFDRRDTPPAMPDEFRHGPMSLDLLRAHSPLWTLKKTNAHVLIQHGEADERVPTTQGRMLYRALDELGVDVTLVLYPRSPHVPREPKLRIDAARRNVDFFTKWVK
jgi:dipeptidyl aminopeptidase/acylaminoacyl peptidase